MTRPIHRVAELFAFDTCTYKCGYCHFAETGKVLDAAQMDPYRDPELIDRIAAFFSKRTTANEKWTALFTGGEPLLMPNLDRLCDAFAASGNKVGFYTALNIGRGQAMFRYLLDRGAAHTDFLMCSFHPESEDFEQEYFEKMRLLKQAGHSVILRLVGHPKRLHRLDDLSAKCREIDVSFYPTPLFSPEYPSEYTQEEHAALVSHMASRSQLIQMRNGVDTTNTLCSASKDMIACDLRTGVITPCVSVSTPILGNIYEDTLALSNTLIECPGKGMSCSCDTHFQQDTVQGFEDSAAFARHKAGFVPGNGAAFDAELDALGAPRGASQIKMGTDSGASVLSIDGAEVKRRYKQELLPNIEHLRVAYHPEFRSRMRGQQ